MGNKNPPVFPEPVCERAHIRKEDRLLRQIRMHLRASHEIPERRHDRYRVLLDRGRSSVTRECDVVQQQLIQRRVRELCNGFKLLIARYFHGNVSIFVEINSGVLLERIGGVAVQIFF